MAEENKNREEDWELSEDFYRNDGEKKELSLEDFISGEELQESDPEFQSNHDELFKKTAADVRRVMKLSLTGNNIEQIVDLTGLERQYVYDILVCAQGFHEDDEIAVAHLVLG